MNSRLTLTLVSLLALAVPAATQNAPKPSPDAPAAGQTAPDLSSPEATVRSFVSAVNRLDVSGANCVVGGTVNPLLASWAADAKRSKEVFQLNVVSCEPQINEDKATAKVTIDVTHDAQHQRFEETLSLQKVGSDWKIVAPSVNQLETLTQDGDKNPHIIAMLSTAYAHPEVVLRSRNAAREAACRSNLKQLATALLMYLQDFDEKFALRADSYKKALLPYVKREDVFRCDADESGPVSYSFNAQLQGKPLGAVRKPSLTVALYEGKKGVLTFRHDGHAYVAFVDGHVKPVTATEARTLRWIP